MVEGGGVCISEAFVRILLTLYSRANDKKQKQSMHKNYVFVTISVSWAQEVSE
jgi:hypothetical protein